MSKEDDAARNMMARGGVIPARPKGAPPPGPTPPPPIDDLLKKRQTIFGDMPEDHPARSRLEPGSVHRVEYPGQLLAPPADADPFEVLVEIMRILRRLPKRQQKQIIEMFADLLD